MASVLVVGGGGREHAICLALSKSKHVDKLYCLPGNAGISEIAECAPIAATDLEGVLGFVKAHDDIVMTVVAPDDPLAMGMVDMLESNGFRAFGPHKNAAIIEKQPVGVQRDVAGNDHKAAIAQHLGIGREGNGNHVHQGKNAQDGKSA